MLIAHKFSVGLLLFNPSDLFLNRQTLTFQDQTGVEFLHIKELPNVLTGPLRSSGNVQVQVAINQEVPAVFLAVGLELIDHGHRTKEVNGVWGKEFIGGRGHGFDLRGKLGIGPKDTELEA